MTVDRSQLQVGMEVVGSNGERVGQVKEVHDFDVLVDRTLWRDICVPLFAIQSVADHRIVLPIPADQVDNMNWPHPPIPGEPGSNQVADTEP